MPEVLPDAVLILRFLELEENSRIPLDRSLINALMPHPISAVCVILVERLKRPLK
jgi:hypothetical protein